MRSFATTRGTVVDRRVDTVPGLSGREGRWSRGGGHRPGFTYVYVVDGVTKTSDRRSYATEGLKHAEAERVLAAMPVAAGSVGVIIAVAELLG